MNKRNTHFEQVSLGAVMEQIAMGRIVEMTRGADDTQLPPQPEAGDAQEFEYPEWQKPYRQALLELDTAKLQEQVAVAESAIARRMRSLAIGPESAAERRALADALSSLRVLKQVQPERRG
jgi:hypothetical protein